MYKLISDDEYKKTFKEESEVTKEALDSSLKNRDKEYKRVKVDKTYKNGDVIQ